MKSEAQRLLDLIHKERMKRWEPVPAGWHPIGHWMAEWCKSRSRTGDFLRVAVEAKIMEQRDFVVEIKGRPTKVSHYRATK
jgi:hypothetical protein